MRPPSTPYRIVPLILPWLVLIGCRAGESADPFALGADARAPDKEVRDTSLPDALIRRDSSDDTRDACAKPTNSEADQGACDGTDDDCDGIVDEGCECDYGPSDTGACRFTQISDRTGDCKPPRIYQNDETRFDFVDNDCDGETDEVVEDVVVMETSACVRTELGKLRCWGGESWGPARADGTYRQMTDGGLDLYCALNTSGEFECWGDRARQTDWNDPSGRFRHISISVDRECGVTTSHEIECRQRNGTMERVKRALQGKIADFEIEDSRSCVVLRSGELHCWEGGRAYGPALNRYRQIDLDSQLSAISRDGNIHSGPVSSMYDPIFRKTDLKGDFVDVAFGGKVAAVTAKGELRDHPPSDRGWPTGRFQNADLVSTHGCAVRRDGRLACWTSRPPSLTSKPIGGFASGVYVGNGGICIRRPGPGGEVECRGTGHISPTDISPSAPGLFRDVAVGGDTACGLRRDGTVQCWGDTSHFDVLPPRAGDARLTSIDAVYDPAGSFCGPAESAELHCWGKDEELQNKLLRGPDGPFVDLELVAEGACGVRPSGKLLCWGDRMPSPPDGLRFEDVAFRNEASTWCGVRERGSLRCWGERAAKGMVPEGTSFESVELYHAGGCALGDEGSVTCWATEEDEPIPDRAPDMPLESIEASPTAMCGLTESRRVHCWGGNIRIP